MYLMYICIHSLDFGDLGDRSNLGLNDANVKFLYLKLTSLSLLSTPVGPEMTTVLRQGPL